jgi:hypothetical protein
MMAWNFLYLGWTTDANKSDRLHGVPPTFTVRIAFDPRSRSLTWAGIRVDARVTTGDRLSPYTMDAIADARRPGVAVMLVLRSVVPMTCQDEGEINGTAALA